MSKHSALVAAIVILFTFSVSAAGDDPALSKRVGILSPLFGQEWVGTSVSDEAREFTYRQKWELILEGHAVRAIKQVDEVGFALETLFYWDPGSSQVAFVSISNSGQTAMGTASALGDTVQLTGNMLMPEENREYRYTFVVTEEGDLEERFFLRPGKKWRERQFVGYRSMTGQGSAEPED
jgi:hypothetical protein